MFLSVLGGAVALHFPCVSGATAQPPAPTSARTLLVFGDSLSAGYGVKVEESWPALLQKRLDTEGYGYRVVNASVSGETTSGGVQRLPRALSLHQPAVVVLELGANDGLRGLPFATTRANLDQMIRDIRASGARLLLVGIRIPPNYGPRYTEGFEQTYHDLEARYKPAFVPFLLDKVALVPGLMQADGLHPNAQGEPIVLDNVWSALKPLLRAAPGH
jgi:acyl-CoA thioesterase-1